MRPTTQQKQHKHNHQPQPEATHYGGTQTKPNTQHTHTHTIAYQAGEGGQRNHDVRVDERFERVLIHRLQLHNPQHTASNNKLSTLAELKEVIKAECNSHKTTAERQQPLMAKRKLNS